MKQRKLVIYFITIVIILLAILPIFNTSFLFINNTLDFKKLNKKDLFSTDNIESSINYYFYKNYKISLNKKQVIIGKDNFLFLGNQYNSVMDKTQGKYLYALDEIHKWVQKLKKVQNWYENRNIKFALAIAPNKHSIYNDKLPENTPYKMGETITDDIVRLALKENLNILDLRSILKEKKESDQLYFTTDSHWNNKGASIGFDETIKYINANYNLKYKIPKYDLLSTYSESGDLADLLKISSLLSKEYEKDYNFEFEHNDKVCHGKIDKKYNLEQCVNKNNPIMRITREDQYMINEHSLNKDNLLLVCDSFGTANSKLYNATFSTIWKFHYNRIYGGNLAKFVHSHKPDIVIYQIAERDLYSQNIITELE